MMKRSFGMKAKLLAAMIALLALGGAVSAQDYHIRTEGRNNLRAAPSLDGRVVETAPSGSVLLVVGKLGRWLKINRNGAEVWMADWVGYSRVEGSQPPAPQPASHIDNCCFVDRQCNTDAEWSDGYWAFQNNQCLAPAGSQPRAAASSPAPRRAAIPLSTTYMTAGVKLLLANPGSDPFNNCCHMHYQGKSCRGDAEWEAGYWAFQNRQCLAPAPFGTRPEIVGNAKFHRLVNRALEAIRIHAPEWLRYMNLSGARTVQVFPVEVTGGGFSNTEWMIRLGWTDDQYNDPAWEPDDDHVTGVAGAIVHEACHAIQQRTYSQSAGWTNEAACVEAQLAVIEAINPRHHAIGWLRNLVKNIQNPEYWWW